MNDLTYGGRHTTNLISDFKTTPRSRPKLEADRSGRANFLPFEEIGSNLGLSRQQLNKATRPIQVKVKDKDVPTKIDVSRNRSTAAGDYTFVPPLRTLALSSNTYGAGATSSLLDEFDSFLNQTIQKSVLVTQTGIKSLTDAARDFYEIAIIAPLVAARDFIISGFITQSYSVTDGLQELARIRKATVVKITAGVVVSALSILLLTQAISDPKPPSTAGQAANTGTAATSSTAAGQTQPLTYPSGSVGFGGGDGSAPTSGTSSTPTSTTTTDPMLVTNPAVLIPYYQVTVPGTTVQTYQKQVIGTTPLTITTN